MNKNLIILILLLGFVGLFSNCKKDGTQVTIADNVIVPSILTFPDLALSRDNSTDTIEFVCSPVQPGFTASTKYVLEACPTGNDFLESVEIYSGIQIKSVKMTVSDLNERLLKILTEDKTSSADFRVRVTLVQDGGTGVEPLIYDSETATKNVTTYGLPRLDLIGSGIEQKIVSPAGDGNFKQYVKLDPANPFTLYDPVTDTYYGGSGGTLVVAGADLTVDTKGYYDLQADINNLTYTIDPYMIAIIGDATGSWDNDQDMDFNAAKGYWYITLDLAGGKFIKFRKNDGWAWNMGLADGENGGLSGDLKQGGVGNDIPIAESGNYTVYFTILSDAAGKYQIVKN